MGDCVELHPKPPFVRELCPECDREARHVDGEEAPWGYHCTHCGCDFLVTGYEDGCLDSPMCSVVGRTTTEEDET